MTATLTRWVPRLMVAVASLHLLFGLFVLPASFDPNPLTGMIGDGLVNTVSGQVDREAAFWFLATGVVWLSFGHLTHWAIRRTGRIPALVGWWTVGLAAPSVVIMPTSGFWLALAVGVVALVAAYRDRAGRPAAAPDNGAQVAARGA